MALKDGKKILAYLRNRYKGSTYSAGDLQVVILNIHRAKRFVRVCDFYVSIRVYYHGGPINDADMFNESANIVHLMNQIADHVTNYYSKAIVVFNPAHYHYINE
jgi:hypothetical protein